MENKQGKIFSLSFIRVLLAVLHYFIFYGFVYRYVATYITLKIDSSATMLLPFLQWTIYAVTLFITICLVWPALKHSYQTFKEHIHHNIATIALLSVVLICINMVLSVAVSLITKTGGSNNQEMIKEAKDALPLITIIATCFIAPFVEECVFRSGVFAFSRRKLNFIVSAVISSLLFASIHFIDSIMTGNFADFSYFIVYFGLGMVLAYSYERSDSIIVSFMVHFFNNALSMLVLFL